MWKTFFVETKTQGSSLFESFSVFSFLYNIKQIESNSYFQKKTHILFSAKFY